MTSRAITLALFFGLNALAFGQAAPAVTAATPVYNPGIRIPMIDGNLQYSLSASELFQSGYVGSGIDTSTNFSGVLEYMSKSETTPFSLLYTGGYLISQYQGAQSSYYQSLTVSQGLVYGRWSLGISDAVSVLPNAPSTGLAGVPGVGDLGIPTQQGSDVPAQSILTDYVERVSNTVVGNVSRQLTGRTSITASGSDGRLYFIDGNGLDTDQISGNVSLNHQLDRRNSIGASASYSEYTYNDNTSSFHSRGIAATYTRIWTRNLTTSFSGGPQWVSSFNAQSLNSETPTEIAVPSRVTFAGGVNLSYTRRLTVATAGYSRSVNGGSGVQTGAFGDSIYAGLSHQFGRDWSTSVSTGFTRTTGLVDTGASETLYSGAQVNRRLTGHLSVWASYTLQHQDLAASLVGTSSFSGVSSTGAIGITYAPRTLRLGQF